MVPQLYEVTEYAVFTDTETPEDDPLFVGTWQECQAYADENPNTTIVWYDEDVEWAPSVALH